MIAEKQILFPNKPKWLFTSRQSMLIMFLLMPMLCFAGDSLFTKANEAYANNRFKIAIEGYQKLIAEGASHWAVHYNLGNAYYKRGRYNNAILHYEKALKKNPAGDDIIHNLQLANTHIVDARNVNKGGFLTQQWNKFRTFFSMDGWAWIGIYSLLAALLGFVFLIFAQKPLVKKLLFGFNVLCVFLFLIFTGIAQSYQNIFDEPSAIIMQNVVNVHSEPNKNGLVLFALHSGSKVEILDRQNNWLKVKFDEEKMGWVQQDILEQI